MSCDLVLHLEKHNYTLIFVYISVCINIYAPNQTHPITLSFTRICMYTQKQRERGRERKAERDRERQIDREKNRCTGVRGIHLNNYIV